MQQERGAMPEHDLIIGKTLNGPGLFSASAAVSTVFFMARSGAGKSVEFSIPNAFTWPGSLICLDIKRELFQRTAGYRASREHSVIPVRSRGTGRQIPSVESVLAGRPAVTGQIRSDQPDILSDLA